MPMTGHQVDMGRLGLGADDARGEALHWRERLPRGSGHAAQPGLIDTSLASYAVLLTLVRLHFVGGPSCWWMCADGEAPGGEDPDPQRRWPDCEPQRRTEVHRLAIDPSVDWCWGAQL